MQSDNLLRMFPAGQQACLQQLLTYFLGHLGRSIYPVSQQIYSCLSLHSSCLVGSDWSFLHNIALPSASGSVAAAPSVTDIMSSLYSVYKPWFYGLFINGWSEPIPAIYAPTRL
jgi:hypothetical protein